MRRSSKAPTISALDAGLRLLAGRPHSRSEVRLKLRRRGYADADVDAAMTRLAELGYLDDRQFAAGHVRRRSASVGPLALSAELAARGVERAAAGEAVAAFGPAAQLASAKQLALRLRGHRSFGGYEQLLAVVGPKLVRRGFSPAIARSACREIWAGTPDGFEA